MMQRNPELRGQTSAAFPWRPPLMTRREIRPPTDRFGSPDPARAYELVFRAWSSGRALLHAQVRRR
jgi:hypothetical protein